MGKYGGLAGIYYNKSKAELEKQAAKLRKGGWRVSVNKYFDMWEMVVRPPKK